MAERLIKREFIRKIVYQRLNWKHNITDCTLEDISNLINSFCKMIDERGIEQSFLTGAPLSYEGFKHLSKLFINYMKQDGVIDDYDEDDIDIEYIQSLVESLIYAEKMFLYCAIFAGDRSIYDVSNIPKSVKSAFTTVDAPYGSLLQLALVYSNTNDPKNLPGIGPAKYKAMQKWMALDCKEFNVYETEEAQGD